MNLLLENLSVGYPRKKILRGINSKFEQGSLVFIIGRNGSGKSTLIKTLAGILKPLEGHIKAHDAHVAYLPSVFHFQETLSVDELLSLYPQGQWCQQKDLDPLLGIEQLRHRNIAALSTGETQRLMLCATLAHPSGIVLLDEPLNYLDYSYQDHLKQIVEDQQKKGRIFLISLHQQEWIKNFAHRKIWNLDL